jgi:signal transduction histidine kinase
MLQRPFARVPRPQSTVRWRLTLLYSGLFLICGAALLAITYLLFASSQTQAQRDSFPIHRGSLVKAPGEQLMSPSELAHQRSVTLLALAEQRSAELHRLLIESGIALAIMAVLSAVLGWIVAGRVLAPLRTITASTERISHTNLHERLAMPGPPDELRVLADTIDRLLERLEEAFDAQRRFVANASHELRTPLAMMRTTLDVAIAKPVGVPTQTRELDAELRVDLDHADRLLDSFLTLARAQHARLMDQDTVPLEPIVTAALAARADQIAAKQLTIQTRLAAAEVPGSATLVTRMIENVIENAVRHNQPAGSIQITIARVDGHQARVLVDSSGPLLDHDAVAQLAQPFRRLGQDRTGSDNGHGLGLSIVAAVAAAHEGLLELHARPEGGLRVQITLPAAPTPHLTGTAT